MTTQLMNKRVAFLATNGVEESELQSPFDAVTAAGATAEIVSTKSGQIQSARADDKGTTFAVDRTTDQVNVDDYDALVIPGGTKSPDRLRMDKSAVRFVRAFVESGKPVASICHGPWMLVEADVVRGRTLTAWPSLKTDIQNAGGTFVDEEVHVEQGIVTSRKPDDLPAFNRKVIEEIAEGEHTRRKTREPAMAGTAR
jgi:protease I